MSIEVAHLRGTTFVRLQPIAATGNELPRGHKAPVCPPLEAYHTPAEEAATAGGAGNAHSTVCESLAPWVRHSASAPALWVAIAPPRSASSARDWDGHFGRVAVRVAHYLTYHTVVGMSGMLLYTDQLMQRYLQGSHLALPFLRSGQLRLVAWDVNERAHLAPDEHGNKPPLGYAYDYALAHSHALLGLSACGANLMLLLADLDEFLHAPQPGSAWPGLTSCLPKPAADGDFIAINTVRRFAALSSTVSPADEAALWSDTPPFSAEVKSQGAAAGEAHAQAQGRRRRGRRRSTLQDVRESVSVIASSSIAAGSRGVGDGAVVPAGRHGTARSAVKGQGSTRLLRGLRQSDSGTSDVGVSGSEERALARVAGSAGGGILSPISSHPLARYDRLAPQPLPVIHSKMIVLPAAEVVAMFVHEAAPHHGSAAVVDTGCLTVLHLSNFWHSRARPDPNLLNTTVPLRNRVFDTSRRG